MRHAIRALGWAANIFWIILLFFTVTAVYSAFQLKPEFGDPNTSTLDSTMTVSLPFSLANGGFYDVSNLNLTTLVKDSHGFPISDSSTLVRLVTHGSNVSVIHNMSISISRMAAENLSYMLFNDSSFVVDIALDLNYANAVPFRISTNSTMPWGAPLSNLTLGAISVAPFNATHFRTIVPISFENHSYFTLDGTVQLELVDNMNNLLGSGKALLSPSVPPQSSYGYSSQVFVSDPTNIRAVRLYFDTSVFSYGPVVIPVV